MKKNLKTLTILISLLFLNVQADAIWVKSVHRKATGGGPNGYNNVSEDRETVVVWLPSMVPIFVRLVTIDCSGAAFEPCPQAIVAQNNDLNQFEEYCYNNMFDYGLTQLASGSPNGSYITIINDGVNSAQYKVEWNTNEGIETVNVYKWIS